MAEIKLHGGFMKNLVNLIKSINSILNTMDLMSNSSIFLTNKNMAKMVLELNEEFKKRRDDTYKLIFGLKGVKKEHLITITDIIETASDLADSYVDRANIVLKKEIHPVLRDIFGGEDKRVFIVFIKENSSLCNRSLLELKMRERTGTKVLAIKRGNKWVYSPGPKERIRGNDVLVCLGDKKSEELTKKIAIGSVDI